MKTIDNDNNKVLLITGCSSGIGYATSIKYAQNGYKVVGIVKDKNHQGYLEIKKAIEDQNLPIELVELELSDGNAIKDTVDNILQRYQRIDVLINNAGFGYISAVEDVDLDKLKDQFQVNTFAPLMLMRYVVPIMREQKSGLIINVSSIMGFSSAALNAPYSSSKHALENISETLALEVGKFGIKVVVVEPGKTNTSFVKNTEKIKVSEQSPYKELYERSANKEGKVTGRDPSLVADFLFSLSKNAVNGRSYTVGRDAFLRKVLRYCMPDHIWVRFLQFFYKWK